MLTVSLRRKTYVRAMVTGKILGQINVRMVEHFPDDGISIIQFLARPAVELCI